VDPADGPAVLARLAATPAQALRGVLTTHHHADHSGGNEFGVHTHLAPTDPLPQPAGFNGVSDDATDAAVRNRRVD
jgi:glyoxylase-like metal-dependent hydrolase (beta-lactamase superfamily II)